MWMYNFYLINEIKTISLFLAKKGEVIDDLHIKSIIEPWKSFQSC